MTLEQKLDRKLREFMSGTVMFKKDKGALSAMTFYADEKDIRDLKKYILKLFINGFNMKKTRTQTRWEKDPHCHWCGVETVYWHVDRWPKKKHGEGMPFNFATIDHLYDKWQPEKRKQSYKSKTPTTVLACNRCNKKRNDERTTGIPKWVRQVRNKLSLERQKLGNHEPRPMTFTGLSADNPLLKADLQNEN